MKQTNIQDKPLTHTGAHARTTLYVLIACEESQEECKAFRELGHIAFSCDIQPCIKTGMPGWHIQGDVTPFLQGATQFTTQDGVQHVVPGWDLIVAHPPCTYLCRVSSVQMFDNEHIKWSRLRSMILARRFFFQCLDAAAPYVAVENPIPMRRANLPKPSCYACPSWFGVKYTKKTLYWLKNLPPIMPAIFHNHPKEFVKASRGKYRSRTFPQLAQALAQQWSAYILDDMRSRPQ